MDIQRLKEAVDRAYELCDQLDKKLHDVDAAGMFKDTSLRQILQVNVLCYLAYISASDGVISWNESRRISKLLDLNLTPAKLDELIREHNVYSTEFEEQVPLALQIFVGLDNLLYENNVNCEAEIGEAIFELYRLLTVSMIDANGQTDATMDPDMRNDAECYLGMMRNYIEENTRKHHTDLILDYGKNKNRRNENNRSGVQAPKKNQGGSGSVKAPKKKA